jgi:hypothetical protein
MNIVTLADITLAEGNARLQSRALHALATFNLIQRSLPATAASPQERNAIAAQLTIAALSYQP